MATRQPSITGNTTSREDLRVSELYCALCGCPCISSGKQVPFENSESSVVREESETNGNSSDILNSNSHYSIDGRYGNQESEIDKEKTWLYEYHHLKLSQGIVPPPEAIFEYPEQPSDQEKNVSPTVVPYYSITDRLIVIHKYCLNTTLRLCQTGHLGATFSHAERMLLSWSLPRWTGWASWCIPNNFTGSRFDGILAGRDMMRRGEMRWEGSQSQQARFGMGVEGGIEGIGKHLLPIDLVSPVTLNSPKSITHTSKPILQSNIERVTQNSSLLDLPSHLLTLIALSLIESIPQPITNHTLNKSTSDDIKGNTKPPITLIPSSELVSFQSFLNTSSILHTLDIPSYIWMSLTYDSIHKFRLLLLKRWRANPTGVGSASQLWNAIDEEFTQSIDIAFKGVARSDSFVDLQVSLDKLRKFATTDDVNLDRGGIDNVMMDKHDLTWQNASSMVNNQAGESYSARDVYNWWMFSPHWRSRRRVWYCVVHGCAVARDADWF